MPRIVLKTSSRLHFGLLSWGDQAPRQFGGVGLMVQAPGLEIHAEPSDEWQAEGPLAARILAVATRVGTELAASGIEVPRLRFLVPTAPREHVGLGVGTQTGMAVTRIVTEVAGQPELSAPALAHLAGRGFRSGIGLHGFALGGLIVDGGRARDREAPTAPLLARLEFPPDWAVLILVPPEATGLHGAPEIQAFREVPALADSTIDRLCRLVLLDLLPAVVEHDLAGFGAALTEIQRRVGQGFAAAQGGTFARPDLADLVHFLQTQGLAGVGQSSWGPTIYGFSAGSGEQQSALLKRVLDRTGWPAGSVFWTRASPTGAQVQWF